MPISAKGRLLGAACGYFRVLCRQPDEFGCRKLITLAVRHSARQDHENESAAYERPASGGGARRVPAPPRPHVSSVAQPRGGRLWRVLPLDYAAHWAYMCVPDVATHLTVRVHLCQGKRQWVCENCGRVYLLSGQRFNMQVENSIEQCNVCFQESRGPTRWRQCRKQLLC